MKYRVTESSIIDAAAELVYRTLADYRSGHPSILPKQYFLSLEVEQGGFGAGTIISFRMKVLGGTESFRAAITEPEPGRVLVETNLGEGCIVSTFVVQPLDGGKRAEVTIDTEGEPRQRGVLGFIERFLTKMMLPRIYRAELRQLASVCEGAGRKEV